MSIVDRARQIIQALESLRRDIDPTVQTREELDQLEQAMRGLDLTVTQVIESASKEAEDIANLRNLTIHEYCYIGATRVRNMGNYYSLGEIADQRTAFYLKLVRLPDGTTAIMEPNEVPQDAVVLWKSSGCL